MDSPRERRRQEEAEQLKLAEGVVLHAADGSIEATPMPPGPRSLPLCASFPPSLPPSPDGVDARGAPLALGLGDAVPLEGESPVEAADHGLVRLHVELKSVPVDGVDDGAHDGAGVLADPEDG